MKYRVLFLLLLLALPGRAQSIGGGSRYQCSEPVSRQQHDADSLLQALDKSQIPTHILYDRVAPQARLDIFNLRYNNPDTSDVHHFLQAYYELHVAAYVQSLGAPCRQVLADNAKHYRLRDTLLVGVLRYRFNYIDSNAVRNNQLRWDTSAPSKLFDVPGRSGSPYLLREVAVAAALADSVHTGLVSFRLDPASTLTNAGSSLLNASIDFGDGAGSRTCTPGQVMQVNYTNAGRKFLRYVLNYADGSQFTTYSTLLVYVPKGAATCTNCRTTAAAPIAACRTESLTAATSFQGVAGKAEVSYYYNSSKSCDSNLAQSITKPIIIIDGIDYDGTRKGANIFGEYLYYSSGGRDQNLGTELRDAGYDVVILDFPNVEQRVTIGNLPYFTTTLHSGADYIERNAYTLVTLIQQLNQRMQAASSTEKIVVIGPSMGGQIARYALAYMEHNNLPHNTRLFLSLDSPHNGATIPIGLQYFVDFFAGVSSDEQLAAGLAQLDSPASRELTVHHHSQGTAFRSDPSRTQLLSDLSSFGNYPSQLRRVAVTNGALDSAPQTDQLGQALQPGQQMFVFEQRGDPGHGLFHGVLGLLSRLVTTASARVYYEPSYGQTQQVLSSYYVLQGRHAQEATGPPGSCGLDSSPGGFRFFTTFAQSSGGFTQERNFYSVRDRACFIPVTSALGYNQQPTDNCQPAGQDLVCNGTIPFDAYYGPTGHNEEHLQLTPGNVEFIRNEILLKTPLPIFLTAPTEVCANGSATYSVKAECVASRPGQPQMATTYTWTLGPGLQLLSGQGTATVQVASTTNTPTDTYLEVVATRPGYTSSAPVRVNVHTGPTVLGPLTNIDGDCAGSIITIAVVNQNVDQDFKWSFGPGLVYDSSYDGQSSIRYQLPTSGPRSWPVQVTAHDKCNRPALVTLNQNILVTYDSGCENSRPASSSPTKVYPNPADASIILETPATAEDKGIQTAVLYNNFGQEVRRQHSSGKAQFMTADLPAGLYHLVLEQNGQVTRHQVQVQH